MTIERLIGIGDLHGNALALHRALVGLHLRYGIFEDAKQLRLQPGTVIVGTGDTIDRGNHALEVIQTYQDLAEQNPGQVVNLLGNHELMALECIPEAKSLWPHCGDGSFAYEFGPYRDSLHGYNGGIAFLSEFGPTPREAIAAYLGRMHRQGDIGSWMRALLPKYEAQVAGKNVLFIHADLPMALRDRQSLEDYLERFHTHMTQDSAVFGGPARKYGDRDLIRNGLFWDRSFSYVRPDDAGIDEMVKNVGVDYLVTGHTPHESIARYGSRIFDIDVGMCRYYGENTPTAIVFDARGVHSCTSKAQETTLETF